jgi:hypothetical protein
MNSLRMLVAPTACAHGLGDLEVTLLACFVGVTPITEGH